MGSGDAGGVLVSPAPASLLNLTTAAVSGRLLEPELIALSTHGGHHLFINRIPPRLPKEDVEKIILAQLRLHPFVLQVSKCSVIPQNSLKNKGYGFITLDGSPSPSDLDAIADSLNNKLQVGCRTLGVRVCTDCHSVCYGDEGCASSSSSTPPNEPAEDDEAAHLLHMQPSAIDTEPDVICSQQAAGAGVAPARAPPDDTPARSSSAPPPQLELLQTAFAALAKQASLPSGLAPVPAPGGSRRRRAVKQQHDPKLASSELADQHQQQPHGGQGHPERFGWRAGKPQGGHGSAPAAGRQRRHTADASPGAAMSADLPPRSASELLSPQEGLPANHSLSPAGPPDLQQQPPNPPPALEHPAPRSPPQTTAAAQQLTREDQPAPQTQQQLRQQQPQRQDGECSGSGAVSGSPRSVSSYSSAPGSGPGSASNSAPGSVCSGHGPGLGSGSGSGRGSGSSAGGWCSREGSGEPGAAPAAVADRTADAPAGVPVTNSAGGQPSAVQLQQQQQPHQKQQQRPPRISVAQNRNAGDSTAANSPAVGQPPASGPMQQPLHMPGQAPGSVARCPRGLAHGPRGTLPAAPVPPGLHGRSNRGHAAAAQRVPAHPTAASQQHPPYAWGTGHASRYGPEGPDHLHSASAPPASSSSSCWYIHQYRHRHEGHDHRRHTQQRQQPHQSATRGAGAQLRDDEGCGSAREGWAGGPVVGGGAGPAAVGGGFARPHAAPEAPYGGRPRGPPRPAWADCADGPVLDGPGEGAERRGSHPGGLPPGSWGGVPAHPHPPVPQYQQQRSPPPPQQQQWSAYPQAQQQMASAAYPPRLPQQKVQQQEPPAPPAQQQPPSLGVRFAPQTQQQQQQMPPGLRVSQPPPTPQQHVGVSFGQPPHHHQQQHQPQLQQPQLGIGGPPPTQHQRQQQRHDAAPHQWQQPLHHQPAQTMSYMQQQQPPQQPLQPHQQAQHAFLAPGGGGAGCGMAGLTRPHPPPPTLSSGCCLPTASPAATSAALPVQLLMGSAGPITSSDAFPVGSPAPLLASSLPPSLAGWCLDLEYDNLRWGRHEVASEPHPLVPAAPGGLVPPLAAAAAATASASSYVGATRSVELFFGRGSSDGFQHPGAVSVGDSTDLDPLDLEPMIMQLLENEDEDEGSSGRPALPAPVQRDYVNVQSRQFAYGQQQAQGGAQPQPPPQQHLRLHPEQPELRPGGGTHRQLSLAADAAPGAQLAPPQPVAAAAAARMGGAGPCVPPTRGSHYQQRHQPPRHRQQQPQRHQQPQRQQAGFDAGLGSGAGSGPAGPGNATGAAAAWTAARPRSDGSSSNSSGDSTVGAYGAAAAPLKAPASAVPVPAAAAPAASLHPVAGAGGGLASTQAECTPQHPAGLMPQVTASAPTAVAAGARWARARADCPGPGLGSSVDPVGSFPGPGPAAGGGGFEGAPGGGHGRGGGVGSGGSTGAGGGHGGYRSARQPGGGRGAVGSGGYGGGRAAGMRDGATGGISGGAGVGAGMAGYRRKSGGGGGFEPQGFVSGSLPNASLLAVMQRMPV